jgi:signal transduction histidine kinase
MSGPRTTGESVLVRRAAVRLGIQAAGFVVVVVIVLTAVAVTVLFQAQSRAASATLDEAITRADDVRDPAQGTYMVMRTGARQDTTPGLPFGAMDQPALDLVTRGQSVAPEERRVGLVDYQVVTQRRADGVVVQGILDLTDNHAERDRLLATMLASGAIGLLLAAAAGTWLGYRALRPLSTALNLQRRFVADAGHELRTPLTLLGTRAQLLRRHLRRGEEPRGRRIPPDLPTVADPRVLADVEGIVADSAHLATILEDLLLAADPLANQAHQDVDLTKICDNAVAAAAAAADERDIALRGPTGNPAVNVTGSPTALARAVTALLDNAVRHASHAVSLTLVHQHQRVLLDVTDDGPGIDPTLAPRLFDRFTTARTDNTTRPRRYGLGLALVAEIVAAHGGQVQLLNPGPAATPARQGATLRITLPAR